MGKKITIKNAAGQVRRHLEENDPDFYAKSGIADSTDEYVVYEILGKKKEDFLPDESASISNANASGEQTPDNTGLTEQQDIISEVAADSSTQKLAPSDTSTIKSGNDLGPLTPVTDHPTFPYSSFLNTNDPAEKLLQEELNSSVANNNFEDEEGNIIDLSSKEVFSPTSKDSNSYRLSHTVDDLDYQQTVQAAKDGKIIPTNKLDGLVGDKEEVPFDTANAEQNRKNLLAANEEMVETSRDSILKHPNGDPLKVKLAETAARRFESAYAELEGKGIELQVSSALVPYNVQMQNHQRYLDNKEKGMDVAFVAHPDSSYHTAGYAIDLARDGKEGTFGMEENIDEIAEVMKRHGWNQHPDEWWHFSVDKLDDIRRAEEKGSGEGEETASTENQTLGIVRIQPSSLKEAELWSSEDGRVKLYDGGVSQSQILDNYISDSMPEIADIITKSGISLYDKTPPGIFGNRIDAKTTAKIIFRGMDADMINNAKTAFQTQLREDFLASSPQVETSGPNKGNYPLTPEQYKQIYANQISGADRTLGVGWARVFARAFDNSLSGNIYANRNDLKINHLSILDGELVAKGVISELNTAESALAGVLSLFMVADAAVFGGVVMASPYVAAGIATTSVGRFLTNFVIKNGLAKGKKAETVVRRVIRHAMTYENGVGLVRVTQSLGIYDAAMEGSRVWEEEPQMLPNLDDSGNMIFGENGQPLTHIDPQSKTNKVWNAYLHGVGIGVQLAAADVFAGQIIANKLVASNLPKFFNNKVTQTIAATIPEWVVFTNATFQDAKKTELAYHRHSLNVEGNLHPTKEEVEQRFRENGGNKALWKQSSIDAAAFLVVMKSMSTAFPAIQRAIEKPELALAQRKALADKINRRIEKNPERPLADIIIETGREIGIPMDEMVGDFVLHNIRNLPLDGNGKPIYNPKVYAEGTVRDIAKKIGIKDYETRPYEKLVEEVYEREAQLFKDRIIQKERNRELNDVGDRKGLTEEQKLNHVIDEEAIINNPDITPEKAATLLIEEQLELGFTPYESSASIRKSTNAVKDQVVTTDTQPSEPVVKKPVKKPVKKKISAKSKAAKAKAAAKAKEERLKTRAEKKRIDRINKSAQEQLEKIQVKVDEAVLLQESNIKQVEVKSSKDIKKPHGFKELTEIIDGKEVPLMDGIFKGKKVFNTLEEFESWRAKLPKKFSETVAVLVKKAQGGKITAQAFIKSTPDVKMVGGKETKGPGLVDRQRHQMDAEFSLAMVRLEEFGDVRQLRDPFNSPMEQLEKAWEYVEQVQILEKQSRNMNRELLEYQLRKKSQPVGEFELTYDINPGKEHIIALKNSAHATEATIRSHKRQINRLISNDVLAKNISKKMILLSKKIGVELTNPKATAKGFIDWSGGDKPNPLNKTALDYLKEDIKMDLAEYIKRAWSGSKLRDLNKLTPTEIGRVLSEKHGLPKKTVTDVMKSIGKAELIKIVRAEQNAELYEAMQGRDFDETVRNSTIPITEEMKSVIKTYSKHFKITGEKAEWVIQLAETFDSTKPPADSPGAKGVLDAQTVRKTATFQERVAEMEKRLPQLKKLWNSIHNGLRNANDPTLLNPKEMLDDFPALAVYNNMMLSLAIIDFQKLKFGTPTYEADRQALANKHQAVRQTTDYLKSTFGHTLRNVGNEKFDMQMIEQFSKVLNFDLDPITLQVLTNDPRFSPGKQKKRFSPESVAEKSVSMLLDIGEAGLEWYRAMLLMSMGPTVKAVFGNTLHTFGLRAVDGIDRMVFRGGNKSIAQRLEQSDIKMKGKSHDKILDARRKILVEAWDKGNLTNEWFEMEFADIAQKRSVDQAIAETVDILTEALGSHEYNPLYGQEYQSGKVGIASDFQSIGKNNKAWQAGAKIVDMGINKGGKVVRGWGQNWMGALDNLYRQPFKMRELHRLALHEGINQYSRVHSKIPDLTKPKQRKEVMKNTENILASPTSAEFIRISEGANAAASRVTFQDKFYTQAAQNLSNFRIAQNNQPLTRLLALGSNLAVPFLVSNVNAWKIANEWLPTTVFTPSFWGDMAVAYPNSVGKYASMFEIFSPLNRRFGGIPNKAGLARAEIGKRFIKIALGTGTSLSMATGFMMLREQENINDKQKVRLKNHWAARMKKQQAYESTNLQRGMGMQSGGIPLSKGGGSWKFSGADPLSTLFNVMDPTFQFADKATRQAGEAMRKSIVAFEKAVPGYTKAVTKMADARENGTDEEFDASIMEYIEVMADGIYESPPLQLWDTINKSTDPNNPNHERVWDLWRGKIISNFTNPTFFRQMLSVKEGKLYQQYKAEQYDEDGLMYTTAESLGMPRKILKAAGKRNPMYDNIAFQDKKTLTMMEHASLAETKGWTFESIAELADLDSKELERQIEMPYSTVNFSQMKYSDKFPIITIFGGFIKTAGGIEKFFGNNLIRSDNDVTTNELTKEYLWLEKENASLESVFGQSKSISIELFQASPEEEEVVNRMGPYRATMKLDEKQNFQRMKLIGDLYKQKMSSILLDSESLLGQAYYKIKEDISGFDKQLESLEKNSDEYMSIDGVRQRRIGELAGIWNTASKAIRHAVDYAVYGEEFNNMKFWRDHMDTYTNNQGDLALEFQALYPEATPEECRILAKDFQTVSKTPEYSGVKRNMMYGELYRKWAKAKGIDRKHIMDPDNIENMNIGLTGGIMNAPNNAYELDLTDDKLESFGRDAKARRAATDLPQKSYSWEGERDPKLGKSFNLPYDYGFKTNEGVISADAEDYALDDRTEGKGANAYQKRTKDSNILSKLNQFKQ